MRIWETTHLAVLDGMEKPMPWAMAMMAVLMPTTRPRESTSGPPELPGLSGAVCWMMFSMSRPSWLRKRPAEGAHHAGGHGGLEAEGIAHGDDQLPDAQPAESPSVA